MLLVGCLLQSTIVIVFGLSRGDTSSIPFKRMLDLLDLMLIDVIVPVTSLTKISLRA